MSENYASGNWHVRQGSEDEFVTRWREFLGWTRKNHPGLGSATLIRSQAQPSRFISFATWESTDERDAWKRSEGFMQRFSACRKLCDDFDGGDFERVVDV